VVSNSSRIPICLYFKIFSLLCSVALLSISISGSRTHLPSTCWCDRSLIIFLFLIDRYWINSWLKKVLLSYLQAYRFRATEILVENANGVHTFALALRDTIVKWSFAIVVRASECLPLAFLEAPAVTRKIVATFELRNGMANDIDELKKIRLYLIRIGQTCGCG